MPNPFDTDYTTKHRWTVEHWIVPEWTRPEVVLNFYTKTFICPAGCTVLYPDDFNGCGPFTLVYEHTESE